MERWIGGQGAAERVPSPADFAAAERAYADQCRRDADLLERWDADEAARLRLEADVCEMWAYEIEGCDRFGVQAYTDALESYWAAKHGHEEPAGGLVFLVMEQSEPTLAS